MGSLNTNISFCNYVHVNFDYIRSLITRSLNSDIIYKVEKIMSIYRLFNNLNQFISRDDKTTYDSYRNEIFMVNKHKLINGIPLNEEDLCGYMYYIHGLNLNLNLDSIVLFHFLQNY